MQVTYGIDLSVAGARGGEYATVLGAGNGALGAHAAVVIPELDVHLRVFEFSSSQSSRQMSDSVSLPGNATVAIPQGRARL